MTVEFWLRWNAFAGDDRLAIGNAQLQSYRGRLPDLPERAQNGGSFGAGIGTPDAGRNNVFFDVPVFGRPSDHYAFVFIRTCSRPRQQITPYVDGQP